MRGRREGALGVISDKSGMPGKVRQEGFWLAHSEPCAVVCGLWLVRILRHVYRDLNGSFGRVRGGAETVFYG